MTPIVLPLRDIGAAPSCRPDQLGEAVDELTPEEVEQFTDAGLWSQFREEDWKRTLLPEFGPPRYFARGVLIYEGDGEDSRGVVVPVGGRNYRVTLRVTSAGRDEVYEARGKTLVLTPTDEPPTPPTAKPPARGERGYHTLQFFGQPVWVQNEHAPQDLRGEPCRHFLTVENRWGDAGNWNVLVGTDADGVPNVAYFEASCC